jgi:hypothetical protein
LMDFSLMTLTDVTKLTETLPRLSVSELNKLAEDAVGSESDIAAMLYDKIYEERRRREALEKKRIDRENLRKAKRKADGGTWV